MLKDFYTAFAAVCFTLLGLWLIVVQTRHSEWRGVPAHRRRAYGVALHFSLPGLMSLLSLVDPASAALWRVSFAVVASSGAIVLLLVRGSLPTLVGRLSYLIAIALYVLIAVVAVVPSVVADVGLSTRGLRVEAVLLIILVFFGVNVAWLLLFDETPAAAHRDSHRLLHAPAPPRPHAEKRPGSAARPASSTSDELRVGGQLPGLGWVRLDAEGPPDPRDRRMLITVFERDIGLGHHANEPILIVHDRQPAHLMLCHQVKRV